MSDILSRDDLIVTVDRLMISAMEDIDVGRDEAGDATLALVLKIEDHDRALRAENNRFREALGEIADMVCRRTTLDPTGAEKAKRCPDLVIPRAVWCPSCVARVCLGRAKWTRWA